MTAPPRPNPDRVPAPAAEADPLALFTVYRSGAKCTLRCNLFACPYSTSFAGPVELPVLNRLAKQHAREQHPAKPTRMGTGQVADDEYDDDAEGEPSYSMGGPA